MLKEFLEISMGKKLRQKDYLTGYEQGFKDALKFALSAINIKFDNHNEKEKDDKEYSSC
jgi:hypothetical protein